MNQEKIGRFIAELRKEKKMTQIDLANKLGITDRAISKWENGRGMPDLSLLTPLCEILDISINELLSGAKLRKSSMDELPQLFNVLKGDMSLVGPRQIVKDEIMKFGKYIDLYYSVKPGITGYWQVCGRSEVDYKTRVKMTVWYINNWSLWLDVKILIKTVSVVLKKTGAY